MGFFTGFKAIFGGAEVVKETVAIAGDTIRGTGRWIDEQKYTDEEKAVAWQKSVETYLKWIELTNTENSLWRVTRRWLAWTLTGQILLMINVSIGLILFGNTTAVEAMIQLAKSYWLGEAFTAIMVTYFGAGLLRIGKGDQ